MFKVSEKSETERVSWTPLVDELAWNDSTAKKVPNQDCAICDISFIYF